MTSSGRLQWIVDQLAVEPADVVLEVGCGNGVATELVLADLTTGRYVAVERSPAMILAAERRNRAAIDAGRATFVSAAIETVSLDTRFDRAFAVRVAALAEPAGLAGLARHLRPGAVVVLGFDAPGGRVPTELVDAVSFHLEAMGFAAPTTNSAVLDGGTMVAVRTTAP
jgi:SAM-dependent methyltransferase